MSKSSITTKVLGLLVPRSAVHPGEVLREEFLKPHDLSANALSIALRLPATRINDIVRERRGISADTALRLARYFGTSAGFWMNLQKVHELSQAAQENGPAIEKDIVPLDAAE
jgi:antitoxin HigA-1